MNLVTRSARHDCNRYTGRESLADLKTAAHRANRHAVNRTLKAVLNGHVEAEEADFSIDRSHCLTGWEVI